MGQMQKNFYMKASFVNSDYNVDMTKKPLLCSWMEHRVRSDPDFDGSKECTVAVMWKKETF